MTAGKAETSMFSQLDPAKLIEILSAVAGVDKVSPKVKTVPDLEKESSTGVKAASTS